MANELLNRTQVALSLSERLVETDDLVELHLDGSADGALLLLDDGVTLKGVAAFQFGDQDITGSATFGSLSILVRVAAGTTATIAHESAVMSEGHRITTATGGALTLDPGHLVTLIYSLTTSRWIAYT